MGQFIYSIWTSFLTSTLIEQVGFALTIFGLIAGLWVNVWTLLTAKRAANAAEEAKNKIFYLDMMIEFPNALSKIAALQKLQKSNQWSEVVTGYVELRKMLSTIRNYLDAKLTTAQKRTLEEIATQLAISQQSIDRAVYKRLLAPNNANALNALLSDFEIALHEIFIQIKVGS